MKCPFCNDKNSKVIDSRPSDTYDTIRRRRECEGCNKRFTTYEKIEQIPLTVIKKDSTREPFSREKLLSGIVRACYKRPVSIDTINDIVDEIEASIHNDFKREVTSSEIGDMVMKKLINVDEVSYVRFASVYRQFKDVSTFVDEVNKLLNEK